MGGSGLASLQKIGVTLSYFDQVDLLGKGREQLENINYKNFYLDQDQEIKGWELLGQLLVDFSIDVKMFKYL